MPKPGPGKAWSEVTFEMPTVRKAEPAPPPCPQKRPLVSPGSRSVDREPQPELTTWLVTSLRSIPGISPSFQGQEPAAARSPLACRRREQTLI